jgi:hypothetical protein
MKTGKKCGLGLAWLALVMLAGPAPQLRAQTNASGTGTDTVDPEKAPVAAASSSAAAPGEGYKLGAYEVRSEIEVGYRFTSGIRGNEEMYRSQVNLYAGARLLHSFVTLRSTPGTGLFDRMDVSLNNWGDPNNSARVSIGRMDLFDFKASYRNQRYFNYVSTLDNPLLGQGNRLPQHALDVKYRTSNFDLRLFPNRRVVPFVGYSRSTAVGPGFTTFGTPGNEFVLTTNWLTATDEFRGGVQLNFSMLNLTLEQGYRHSKNDTGVTNIPGSQGNEGNASILGNSIFLNGLTRGYHSRTKLPISRVLAKFTPFRNLRMVGRYIYSMGDTSADMGQIMTGGFVTYDPLVYAAAADGMAGRAKRPNHNGSFLIEFSPISRVTLSDSVDTVDYHVTGAGLLSTLFLDASSLLGPSPKTTVTQSEAVHTLFAYNEVRNQAELEVDVAAGISARAGHRYRFLEITSADAAGSATADLIRNTAFVGMVYRPGRWLRFGVDYEKTSPDNTITRNELFKYDRVNVDWRIGDWHGLSFNGRIGIRNHTNAAADIDLKGYDETYSGSINFEPNERLSMRADFSRTNLFSDLLILLPQSFKTAREVFDQRVCGIGGGMGWAVYKGVKAEFGYHGAFNQGTFPLEFHQPFASLWIPLRGGLAFKPAWQYFGYRQSQYELENYQRHLVTFSLVFAR